MIKNKFLFAVISISTVLFLIVSLIICKRVVAHESWQSKQIHLLSQENENFKEEINNTKQELANLQNEINKYGNSYIDYSNNAYNYLAIGNSITKHPISSYWWNEIGMAATKAENDYYHTLVEDLKNHNNKVICYSYNFSNWETQSWDRAETLESIKPYLSPKLDLITIQLGENVTDLTTFEHDFRELINYIKANSANAKIIIVGDFWIKENRDEIKKNVASELGVKFVDLSEIHSDKYQCGLGTIVYDEFGREHVVEHEGVAIHPNDEGMRYIANAIIKALDE